MLVGPSSRPHQAMWWMSQAENTTVQSGWAQVRCIARNAPALGRGGGSSGASDVEDLAGTTEHDRQDVGVTAQSSHRLDR